MHFHVIIKAYSNRDKIYALSANSPGMATKFIDFCVYISDQEKW